MLDPKERFRKYSLRSVFDGNKKIKGRKEHIVVDTLGLPMSVRFHPANVHDSVGAEEVFESMRYSGLTNGRTDLSLCQKDGLSSALSHGSRTSGD